MRQLKWLSLLGLLLLGPSTYAQSVRFQSQAISSRGAGIANATVAVCTQPSNTNTQPCSPLATLATSTSTTSGGANPLTADSFGNFFFYAAPGTYTVQIYGPAVSGQFVVPDTVLACAPTACTVKQINGSSVIDANCLANWGVAEIGACINAAYAAGPSTGVDITVAPGSYNFTTPIVFNTLHKAAYLHGSPGQITYLNYTPTTGTAITFDYGETSTVAGYGHGMFGIHLNGPGPATSTTALTIGTVNGSEGFSLENFGLQNFGTCLNIPSSSPANFFQRIKHGTMGPCSTTGWTMSVAIENVLFEHVKWQPTFGAAITCLTLNNGAGLLDANFFGNSFDNCNVSVAGSPTNTRVSFTDSHFEQTSSAGANVPLSVSGGAVNVKGSLFQIFNSTGAITCNTGNCSLSTFGNYYGANAAATTAINVTNGGKVSAIGDVFLSPSYTNPITTDGTAGAILNWQPSQGSTYTIPKVIYNTQSAAVNTNISAVTMATQGTAPAILTNTFRVSFYAAVVTPGTSCTGTTTVNLNLIYTDPNGAGSQTLAVTLNVAVNSNGTAGNVIFTSSAGLPELPIWVINAKNGTAIQWSTTSFTAGTGCSPAPTYQITPRLETM